MFLVWMIYRAGTDVGGNLKMKAKSYKNTYIITILRIFWKLQDYTNTKNHIRQEQNSESIDQENLYCCDEVTTKQDTQIRWALYGPEIAPKIPPCSLWYEIPTDSSGMFKFVSLSLCYRHVIGEATCHSQMERSMNCDVFHTIESSLNMIELKNENGNQIALETTPAVNVSLG